MHLPVGWTHKYPRYRQTATFHGFRFLAQRIPIHQLTQNLCFKHSFPPLNSWSRLRQTNRCTYQWGEHISTPDTGKQLHFMVFGYLFLAQTDTNPLTNSKSMFQHSILLLHSSSRFRRTNRYTYQWGAIHKRFLWEIWGHGICWQKGAIHKVFSAKIVFFTSSQKFLPLTFSHYMVHINGGAYIQQFVH